MKKRRLTNMTIGEVSSCREGINKDAKAVFWKAADDDVDVVKGKFNEVLQAAHIEEAVRAIMSPMYDYSEMLRSSFYRVLADENISPDQKESALKTCIEEFASELTKALSVTIQIFEKEAKDMPDKETVYTQEQFDKAVKEAVDKALDEQKARVDELSILAKMTAEEKSYYDSIQKDDDKALFRKATVDQRKELIKKAKDEDETYTTAEGRVIRKSVVGDDTFAVLKSQEERIHKQAETIRIEKEKRELAEFEKAAEKEYPNVPGEPIVKAKILRQIDSINDESVKKGLLELLKSANNAIGKSFDSIGGSGSGNTGQSVLVQITDLATQVAKSKGISIEKAKQEVILSNPELYREYEKEMYGN
jgi:hypothetical protein